MTRRISFVLALLFLVSATSSPFAQAQENRLQVMATHTILADVVANVAGDAADVIALMPVNADPHTFVPAPSDVARLADADLVFVNGVFFEEGLLEVIENAAVEVNIVEASQCVPIIPFGAHDHDLEAEHAAADAAETAAPLPEGEFAERCAGYYEAMTILHGGDAHADHQGDEAEQDAQHGHGVEPLGPLYALDCSGGHGHEAEAAADHDHIESGCDPHVWWEPHNVIFWAMTIRDSLAELDPANADAYAANAAAYIDALDALAHDEIHPLIESLPAERRILVTDHDSLGYFANAYGFEVVGVVIPGGSTLAEPGSAETAALIDLIRQEGVPAIIVGSTVSSVMADQVSAETGAQITRIYTDSLSEAGGPAGTYLDFMRYNAGVIVGALGASS